MEYTPRMLKHYKWIIKIDLQNFFNEINHEYLLNILGQKILDQKILGLIKEFLKAEYMDRDTIYKSSKGSPQGSPLSPVLSNVILNNPDQEIISRNHKIVRYADDAFIMVKSARAARRVIGKVIKIINEMHLIVNQEKSGYMHITEIDVLGFRFYVNKAGTHIILSPDRITRFKDKVKYECQCKNNNVGDVITKVNRIIIGWINSVIELCPVRSSMKRRRASWFSNLINS